PEGQRLGELLLPLPARRDHAQRHRPGRADPLVEGRCEPGGLRRRQPGWRARPRRATVAGTDRRPSAAHPRGAVGDVQPQRKLGAEPLVDRPADLVERAALRGEPRPEHRLAHADVALRAVIGLEAGEQRAMPEMLGALAVAMDAVEYLWRDRKS